MCKEYEIISFDMVPMFATNFNADINVLDVALWDRLMMILFPVAFVRGKPKNHFEKERNEALTNLFRTPRFRVSYFNWLVRSSAFYYQHRNDPIPEVIKQKIKELRRESFALSEFLESTGKYEFDESSHVKLQEFFNDFKTFARESSEKK